MTNKVEVGTLVRLNQTAGDRKDNLRRMGAKNGAVAIVVGGERKEVFNYPRKHTATLIDVRWIDKLAENQSHGGYYKKDFVVLTDEESDKIMGKKVTITVEDLAHQYAMLNHYKTKAGK